jgi:small-conductance mechanosensitive channel
MIADTVAGIYLLRDPDFNPGDTVTTGSLTGTVRSIGLRKSRFEVDGDTVVVANREVESKWTLRTGGESAPES